ncbi:MAG TPA: hypothetical protein VF229_03020, partial [Burkholderiaceae bacterium]
AEGEPSAVQRHPAVVRAYLGGNETADEPVGEAADRIAGETAEGRAA